jgi:hypothetical protein
MDDAQGFTSKPTSKRLPMRRRMLRSWHPANVLLSDDILKDRRVESERD